MININFHKITESSEITLAIGTTFIVLVVFWGFVFFVKKQGFSTTKQFFTTQLSGMFLFGVIPFLLVWYKGINLSFSKFPTVNNDLMIYLLIILIPVIFTINYQLSKKKAHQDQYPKIRRNHWSISSLLINAFLWILYLVGYEFLFRGLLLHTCLDHFSTTIAIIVNTIIYSLAHVPKGKFETLGAIPLGILFCLITIWTQTFWTVCILHCIIATSNDLFCIIKNPDMSIALSFKKTAIQ